MKADIPRVLALARISSMTIAGLLLGSAILLPSIMQSVQANPGIGYWIIVEGGHFHGGQAPITYGCMQVYQILRGVGYSSDRINYLWAATKANLTSAIVWAGTKVTPDEPLWIYMFDHGDGDVFYLRGGTSITYQELDYLFNISVPSDVNINLIVVACNSGWAINYTSTLGRMIITTCNETQDSNTWLGWEAFSVPFWDKVKAYQNVRDCFNYAYSYIKNVEGITDQDPLLDDNGDRNGTKGPLSGGVGEDGFVASSLYIGSHAYTPPVGGLQVPVDKLALLAPYLALAVAVVMVAVGAVYARKRWLQRSVNRILFS